MKKTENPFPKLLGDFLSVYLPAQRNYSNNTIASYCDSFRLLLQYLKSVKGLSPEQVTFKKFNHDCVNDFLRWLEESRNSSKSTINQRLSALHSFFRYVQNVHPELIFECKKIIDIPFLRKPKPAISYLCQEDLKLILEQPNPDTRTGRRDMTLLSLLYDTGGRVQEIADLTVSSVRLEPPAQIILRGKGDKSRVVPLMSATAKLLANYMRENKLGESHTAQYPVFFNQRKEALSRAGVSYVLRKYSQMALQVKPSIPNNITPHVLRHSKAMHLLEVGVNIIYIRDILGHVDVSTTEVYAKANLDMKRKALEKVSLIPDSGNTPYWTEDANLLSWLEGYGRSLT